MCVCVRIPREIVDYTQLKSRGNINFVDARQSAMSFPVLDMPFNYIFRNSEQFQDLHVLFVVLKYLCEDFHRFKYRRMVFTII